MDLKKPYSKEENNETSTANNINFFRSSFDGERLWYPGNPNRSAANGRSGASHGGTGYCSSRYDSTGCNIDPGIMAGGRC
jgi:hypothetical protein